MLNVNGYQVPEKYDTDPGALQGTVVCVDYETRAYGEDERTLVKKAYVYLPGGYSEEERYPVLYLMHGGGERETYWLLEHPETLWMVDGLIRDGAVPPVILVTPTFYPGDRKPDREKDGQLPYHFHQELRRDLIPAIESRYATFAGFDVSEDNLRRTRAHRGFAGLSMGSMTTYWSALTKCLDLFAWYGPFSGCIGPKGDQEAAAREIVKALDETFAGYDISYLLACNGTRDIAHDEHVNVMRMVLEKTAKLTEGKNYTFIDIPDAEHEYPAWKLDLYYALQVFFRTAER